MSVPPPRRIKVAPKYIGVSVDVNKIVIPSDVKANERVLGSWGVPTTASVTSFAPHLDSTRSKNDSEASTSENDSEASTTDESRDDQSEAETDRETEGESASQSPYKSRRTAVHGSRQTNEHTMSSELNSSQTTVTDFPASSPQQGRQPRRLAPLKPLDLGLGFVDLIFEFKFASLCPAKPHIMDHGRKVVHFERAVDDDAVSIWPTRDATKSQCSISCIASPDFDDYLLTLYDFQRFLTFVAGNSKLADAARRRVRKAIETRWAPTQITEMNPLFKEVVNFGDPKPALRKTAPFWVLSWGQFEQAITAIVESDNVVVTIL